MKAIANAQLMKRIANLAKFRQRIWTKCCNPTASEDNEIVISRDKIQIDLIKLADGNRLLRLTDPNSGMSLERKIDSTQPVNAQKERLLSVFEAALARAEVVAS